MAKLTKTGLAQLISLIKAGLNGKADIDHTHDGYASSSHTHAASTITAGTFAGAVIANPSDLTTAQVLNIVVTNAEIGVDAATTYPVGTVIIAHE